MELINVIIFIPTFSKDKIAYFKEEFLQGFISSDEFYESPKYSLPVLFETENFPDRADLHNVSAELYSVPTK
jgi:hypothetical protein